MRVIYIPKVIISTFELKHLFAIHNIPNDHNVLNFEGGADQFAVDGPIDVGDNSLALGLVLWFNPKRLFLILVLL